VAFNRKDFVVARAVAALLFACLTASACADSTTAATAVTSALSSLVLSTTSVVGGAAVTGVITLTSAAPTGGATVTVVSSSTAATVPASVLVPAGSTTQSFSITTTSTTASVTFTATYAGLSQTAGLTVTVIAVPTLQSVFLSSNVATGGLPVQGTVTMTAPAPAGGLAVTLLSSSALVSVPATVTVPQGATTASFQVNTVNSSVATAVTITASYAGVTQTAALTLGQLSVTLLIGSVPGGLAATGVVTLPMPAPDGGALIQLSSSTPVANVPASIVVPAGATSQTFTIATINAPPTTTATISATYAGASQTATLVIVSYTSVASLTCSSPTPQGGTTVQCAGTLSGPAPSTGVRLSLASSDPSITVPSGVTVAPGSQSFQFALATTTVAAVTPVSVEIFDALSNLPLWGQIFSVTP